MGLEIGGKVIQLRKECREIITLLGGKVVHPVFGLPGGVSKPVTEEDRKNILKIAKGGVEFAQFALSIFNDVVLKNKEYVDIITGDLYVHQTYYMGLVDQNNQLNFYDGDIRVVDPAGKEFVKFKPGDYLNHMEEHVEPWSYIKFPFLKKVGWHGFEDGKNSGIFRVAPLARLNAAKSIATPLAQAEAEKMFDTLGGKPAHFTLAFHWARLIEALYAAERMVQLAEDPELADPHIRNIPTETPTEGVGVVEAPRGTLFHHYKTDEKGILTEANLIVATQNNAGAICMSVDKAAKGLIKKGKVNEGLLNMVEMAFRAYDPCFACGTHSLPGEYPIHIELYNADKELIQTIENGL